MRLNLFYLAISAAVAFSREAFNSIPLVKAETCDDNEIFFTEHFNHWIPYSQIKYYPKDGIVFSVCDEIVNSEKELDFIRCNFGTRNETNNELRANVGHISINRDHSIKDCRNYNKSDLILYKHRTYNKAFYVAKEEVNPKNKIRCKY